MRYVPSIALVVGLSCGGASHAVTVFSDNFDANPLGIDATPAGWAVEIGSVDIVGTNSFGTLNDVWPGHGAYVDFKHNDVRLQLMSHNFAALPNTRYTLEFDLAGNKRAAETAIVGLNFGTIQTGYAIEPQAPFKRFSLSFVWPFEVPDLGHLEFIQGHESDFGVMIDNVTLSETILTPIPEPRIYAMMLAGLVLLRGALRNRRAQSAACRRSCHE